MDEAKWETWKALTYPTKRGCYNCFHAKETKPLNVNYLYVTYMGNRTTGSQHICTLAAGMMCDVYNTHWISNERPYINWTDKQKHRVKAKTLWEWNGK